MNVDIICPTRGRPDRAREMAESCLSLAGGHVRVTLGVDEDDPSLPEYKKLDFVELDIGASSGGCVSATNRMAMNSTATHVQFMGDDCLMLTEGWDELLTDATPDDGIGAIYAMNDERHPAAQPYHPMLTHKWLDIVGWFTLPALRHYGMDTVIAHMAKKLKRAVWVDGVVIKHRHYQRSDNPIPHDEVYASSESMVAEDNKAQTAGAELIREKIEELRSAMA